MRDPLVFSVIGAIAFLLILGAWLAVDPYEVPDGVDVFSVVEGAWDWGHAEGRCVADPVVISFSAGRDTMYLRHREPIEWTDGTARLVTPYEIQGVTRNSIRGFIPHETRTTAEGALVVWDLVLNAEDSFCWHRTDWPEHSCTRSLLRCDAAALPGEGNGV